MSHNIGTQAAPLVAPKSWPPELGRYDALGAYGRGSTPTFAAAPAHATVREGVDPLPADGPVPPQLLPLLNGNCQRAERRAGSPPDLQRGSNKQELIHVIFRQVF